MAQSSAKKAESSAEPVLLRENVGPVAVLTLNRPAARNSLSEALLAALTEEFAAMANDKNVRAIVLTANGPAFCAGHDMKEMTARRADKDGGRAYFTELMTTCSTLMQAIVHQPQPVIAAVQGVASAAGCQLVASCDLAIASEKAGFCTPGVHIGLFCSTPMVALSRNVARKHTMEMLLTGDTISAQEGKRIGLINRVVLAGMEREAAITLARQIASKSMMTLKVGKAAFYQQIDMPLAEAYRHASAVMVENMMKRDAAEGIGAFIDKREPKWEDR